MPIEVTEDLLRAITTKEKALSDGRTLARKGAFLQVQRSADASLLWGQCKGSGAKPYGLSIDLAGDHPTIRCSCPVKPPPCKHTLGLLVYFLEKRAAFKEAEPLPELLEKRAKNTERAERRAEAAARPKEVNKAALEKRVEQQKEGLALLERLVVDVAADGLATMDDKRAERLMEQARQMNDAYLPGAAVALKRLAALARASDEDDTDVYYRSREPGLALPLEDRHRLMQRHLARLWTMVKKGQKTLDEKLEEGESQDAADAIMEELLGRVWQLPELRARNAVRRDLSLLELAFERYDDGVKEERVEQSYLLDLQDGALLAAQAFRPFHALDKVPGQNSYEDLLGIAEAVVYPGFVNRRIRWELAAYKARPATAADWQKVHAVALPALDAALARYKEQIKNPLAPDEAVFFVRARDIARSRDGLVLVDEKGARLALRDSPVARSHTVNNLAMAAGASLEEGALRQPASALVRFWLGLADNAVYGQPLALVVGGSHIRLGM
jgi:uncharacterized Zn finger protein